MDTLFTILKYLVYGFFGLLGLLILLALVFGKRIRKQWEYEAEFRDPGGREFGEFDIESSRIEKEEPDYTLKAKLRIRHPSLQPHQTVQVFIDDTLVLEHMVEKAGSVFVRSKDLRVRDIEVSAGQRCRIVIGGTEMWSAEIKPD